jgi:hypothetical protein
MANYRYSTRKIIIIIIIKSTYNYFSDDKFKQVVTQDISIKIIV